MTICLKLIVQIVLYLFKEENIDFEADDFEYGYFYCS
jgi:hypothetical protein